MSTTVNDLSAQLERRFVAARERTRRIFDLLAPEAYEARPISLRHPFVFYDGHLDAFLYNTALRDLGVPSVDPALDALFARGIDPEDEAAASSKHIAAWPARQEVRAYKAEVALALYRALRDPDAVARAGELFWMCLEHELMHQETLMYLIHQLPHHLKRPPAGMSALDLRAAPAPRQVSVPAGPALLGAREGEIPFSWDNERPAHEVEVPAFGIDAYNVTNGQFLAFVADGGYQTPSFWTDEAWAWKETQGLEHPPFWRRDGHGWAWHSLFEDHPLPVSWPVVVTHAEASAYARYVGGDLPTEPEWHRAAFGEHQDWHYPWGDEAPGPEQANLGFRQWSPTPVGAHPAGAGPLGVHDMVGNGWEWTATPFAPFEGFSAHPNYPGYSADFFDGKHWVMKGASWVTDPLLARRSFRNWFYGHYPHMYATFRCVQRH